MSRLPESLQSVTRIVSPRDTVLESSMVRIKIVLCSFNVLVQKCVHGVSWLSEIDNCMLRLPLFPLETWMYYPSDRAMYNIDRISIFLEKLLIVSLHFLYTLDGRCYWYCTNLQSFANLVYCFWGRLSEITSLGSGIPRCAKMDFVWWMMWGFVVNHD